MMDLIVLGIIPGTSFVITLWWAVLMALIASVLLLIYIETSKPQKGHTTGLKRTDVNLEQITIAGMLNPIFHMPNRNLLLGRKQQD